MKKNEDVMVLKHPKKEEFPGTQEGSRELLKDQEVKVEPVSEKKLTWSERMKLKKEEAAKKESKEDKSPEKKERKGRNQVIMGRPHETTEKEERGVSRRSPKGTFT